MTIRYSIISGSTRTVPPKFFAKWEAANGLCCVCATDLPAAGETFTKNAAPTLEHVFPKSPAAHALAHAKCNRDKGNRAPTGCEVVFLMAVNSRIGQGWNKSDRAYARGPSKSAKKRAQRRRKLARSMQAEFA